MAGPRYKAVLLDLDGVLFDFGKAESHALRQTFDAYHLHYDEDRHLALYRTVNHRYWADFEAGRCSAADIVTRRFPDFLAQARLTVDPAAFNKTYLGILSTCRFLLGDPLPVLQYLHGKVPMAIVTNGLRRVQRSRLAGSPIAACVDAVVISEEIGAAKPDPAVFRHALAQIGNPPPGDTLMVGDSLSSDITGGRAAGLHTCWFNPAPLPLPADAVAPDHVIERLDELPGIIGL